LALITLLDPIKRREYDSGFGKPSCQAGSKRRRTAYRGGSRTPCDVRLVLRI
jgi:hypothetical protein